MQASGGASSEDAAKLALVAALSIATSTDVWE